MKLLKLTLNLGATALLASLAVPTTASAFRDLREAISSTREFCPASAAPAFSTALLNGRVQVTVDFGVGVVSTSVPYIWNTYSTLDSCRVGDRPVLEQRFSGLLISGTNDLRTTGSDHQLVLNTLSSYVQILESSGFLRANEMLKIELKLSSAAGASSVEAVSIRLFAGRPQRRLLTRSFTRQGVSGTGIEMVNHGRAVLTSLQWLQTQSAPALHRAQINANCQTKPVSQMESAERAACGF